jgi:hypothetical protein
VAKANLRVTKWLGSTPAAAGCTGCNQQFKVPISALKRLAEAQQHLKLQFETHHCNTGQDANVVDASGAKTSTRP